MTPFWARVKQAEEAATEALYATTPEGWSAPLIGVHGGLTRWTGSGWGHVTVSADERRGHAGEIVVRAALRRPRSLVVVATVATVEADLRAAFAWVAENLNGADVPKGE